MQLNGAMTIGSKLVLGTAGGVQALDPARGVQLEPVFGLASEEQVQEACALAERAVDSFRNSAPEQRAALLEAIAGGIEALGATLIERAMSETGLPRPRLEGERARTVGQLRLFAKVVRDGHWQGAVLDSALPQRSPPRPDLRRRHIPLGPVAVFGASNFPLAFSVAGGDTASALAAGCPVVVKAHGAHLGTSELVARVIQQAVGASGLPEGVFSMLIGEGRQIGLSLVANPAIKAVGFTGSRQAGVALMRTAAARAEPIPVYAEMSSVNPVFMLPHALQEGGAQLAQAYVESLTMSAGQLCTNPGLVLGLAGPQFDAFIGAAGAALEAKAGATMLTPGIHQAYTGGVARLSELQGVAQAARGQDGSDACSARPALYVCDAATYLSTPALHEEVFGPCAVLLRCRDQAEMLAIAGTLEGQLTATVRMAEGDLALAAALLPVLERKAGRILFNGFPTGVEVCHAMVHGGPFPSTSDSRSTSVGTAAIDRFLRPVCYQNVPAALLPAALADANPLRLIRLVDGNVTPPA